MTRQVLGKGLGALLPPKDQDDVKMISISEIIPNPHQPRKAFDDDSLNELALSIKEHGVIQPILLRRATSSYEIIAGERRWRAAKIAGLKEVPALIRTYDDKIASQVALIENLQREDLNPLEEAEAFSNLIEQFAMTQEMIANAVGKSRTAVANTLRLLNLTDYVKENVSRETITGGHARALLPLTDPAIQDSVCDKIIANGWSVRNTEEQVKRILGRTSKKEKPVLRPTNPFLREIAEKIGEHLGTKVDIKQGKKANKIEVEFYDQEDLHRILIALGITTQ